MRGKLRRAAAAATVSVVGLGGTGVALVATATPAFAAGVFVSPPVTPTDNPSFTLPADAKGNPLPPDVVSTNFPPNNSIFIEVCDGKSPSAQGYDVTIDCDNTTSPTQIQSQGLTYQEMFKTSNHNEEVLPFRGMGGSDVFNCLAPEDVKPGTKPSASDGSVTPIGDTTKNGNPIDTGQPSWNNCKVKVSSNNASNTADQSFITFSLANTPAGPPPSTPEAPLAVILPLGAAGLFAGGFAINRRRRSNHASV